MSIRPEKLKQYISLKEAALTLRPDFADVQPQRRGPDVDRRHHAPLGCRHRRNRFGLFGVFRHSYFFILNS